MNVKWITPSVLTDAGLADRISTQVTALSRLLAPKTKQAELRGVISTKPGLNRYLRVTPGGLLRIDAAAIKAEENLDGKYLLRTSDPKLSAEDIALGYKQLPEVERGWRDLKQVIDLRPVYHRKEERIRAHVILCWLALLLIRIAETTTGVTWAKIADEQDLLTLGTFRARPARSGRPPSSPRPSATFWPSSRSRTRRRSSRPPRQAPDQQRYHRLVTRPVTTQARVRAGQTTDPGTMPDPHLRNPGACDQDKARWSRW